MTDYKSALQKTLDLYQNFEIDQAQYIEALEAIKSKFPDEFEEGYLQAAKGDESAVLGEPNPDATAEVETGELEMIDTDSGQETVVMSTEYDPMMEDDPNEFQNFADFSEYYDKYGPQAKKYRNWLTAPSYNYPITENDAIYNSIAEEGIYRKGELPSQKEIMNAIKNNDKEFFIKYNLDRKKLLERAQEIQADYKSYIQYAKEGDYDGAVLKLYEFTDEERKLLNKADIDPDLFVEEQGVDLMDKTEDFKLKIRALRIAAEDESLSDEERKQLENRADYLENTILKEGNENVGYDFLRKAIYDATYAPDLLSKEGLSNAANKFGKTVLDIAGGTLRINNFMSKLYMQSFYEDELNEIEKKYAGDASAEAKAINDFVRSTPAGQFNQFMALPLTAIEEVIDKVYNDGTQPKMTLANLFVDIADNMDDAADALDENIFKYELGVSQTFKNAKSLGGAFDALGNMTYEIIGSLPYMITSATGAGGLVVIGGSTAAGGEFADNEDGAEAYRQLIELTNAYKQGDVSEEDYNKQKAALEKRMQNADLNFTNLGHHAIIGMANSVLERFSGRLGRQVFNSLGGASKREVKKGLTKYFTRIIKDSGGEGITEGVQTGIEILSDHYLRGNLVEFEKAFTQVLDATIIGMGSGFGASGSGSSIDIVRNAVTYRTESNVIKNAGKNDSAELFDPTARQSDPDLNTTQEINIQPVSTSQIQFVTIPNSDLRLNADLDVKIKNEEITVAEANAIKNEYRQVQGAVNILQNTTGGAIAATNTEAVNLMVEKKNLIDEIAKLKEVSPEAAVDAQNRLDEVNARLGEIVKESTKQNRNKKKSGVAMMSLVPGLENLVGQDTPAIFDLDDVTNKERRKREEEDGINETLLKTIKNPDSKKADINQATDALIENNLPLYYKAVGFDPQRGDISGKAVMEAIRPRLGPIIKNFDPSKGVTWSTYVTDSLGKKKQEIYNEAGIGQQNISLDAEGAMQVADKQADQDTQQDIPQRPKVYPSQLEAVAKVLTPEVRETQNAKVKDEIIRSINDKGVDPKTIATDLIGKTREKEIRNVIKSAVGRFGSPEYNQFVDDVVNQDFINSLPVSTIKGRFGKLFGIEEISRTPTKNVREGKKDSNFKKQVFRIPKTTPEKLEQIKEYFKENEKRSQSLFSLLAEGAIVEEVQTMRGDTDFMNKLNDVLELKGSKLNAEQFMDQLQKDADQRTKEDTSLDIVEDVIASIDKAIDFLESKAPDSAFSDPFGAVAAAEAARRFTLATLKAIRSGIQKGKSFVQALRDWIDSAKAKEFFQPRNKAQEAEYDTLKELTQDQLGELYTIVQSVRDKINQLKYEDVVNYESERISKILKDKKVSREDKIKLLEDFFVYTAPSYIKANSNHGLFDNAKTGTASNLTTYNYFQDKFGVKLKDYGFTVKKGGSIKLDGKPIEKRKLRPSKGFTPADIKNIEDQIQEIDQFAEKNKTYLANRIADLVAEGRQDVALELLDIGGLTSDSGLRVIGKIMSYQKNPPSGEYVYEHSPPIDDLRKQIEKVLETDNDPQSVKRKVRAILDTSKVDLIDKGLEASLPKLTGRDIKTRLAGQKVELTDIVRTNENLVETEAKAKSKIANTASDIVSDKQTTAEVKQTLVNSQDARNKAQEVKKETKGLSAFDFDDTLALTKEKVLYTMPDGTTGELTAGEFAVQAEQLTAEGAEFDFSNFEDVDISTLEGPMVGEAKKKQKKFGPKDIFVVTARPNASVDAIHRFLKGIGLNIPKANITGLGNGDPQAKADWFLQKATEGYNDFYFSDDSLLNVQQVKNVLDQIDVKSKVQQAIASKEQTLDEEFNKQIEEVTGRKAGETVSDVRAKLEGRRKDGGLLKRIGRQFTITASAADFLGLLYSLAGKGRQGDRHLKFIDDHLIKPYNKAEQELLSAKVTIAADFAAIKNAFPTLRSRKNKLGIPRNPLSDEIGVGPYTKSHAVRVYLWNKQGTEIPGIDQTDVDALVEAVENDLELLPFAENILLIQKGDGYPAPKNAYWIGGDIASDIMNGLDTTYRGELLTEWKQNVDIILSDKNLNKLEAVLGSKWVEAIKDSVSRMTRGSNRPIFEGSGSRQVNDMLDWLNASVGAVMFLNMRSGLLQLISNVNFINWGDNNIYNAAQAFASKEYVPTVIKLMNSDYLVNRRDGLKINVNEAELTEAANKGGIQGMISYLLDKGFVITRIMDSLAIATGGATFFINRQKSLLNRVNEKTGKLYTPAEAETKAFDDFYAIAEETQQSSNPSKISSQQASYGGRLLLSFQNVTMQYNRKTKKMIQDLYNRRRRPGMTQRESDLSNISGVIYYVGVQNLIFNGLQQALFAQLFDDDDEYRKEQSKTARIANGMLDSLLNGLGFGGAIVSTVKNIGMRVLSESEKESPKYIDAVDTVFDVSPVLDAKIRKLKSAAKTFEWNMQDIKRKGWDLENPAYLAISQIVSAFTNVPIDRVLRKGMNIAQAFDEETKTWQTIALLMGWSGWNVGLPYWGLESTIKKEAEEKEKFMEKYKNDVRKFKNQGFTKRIPFTGKNALPKGGKPEGELGVDYIAIQRYDGKIQYYIKPKK